MDKPIRTFIAIELEDSMHDALRQMQDHFKELDVKVKWVKPENIHITLRFLGNISPKKTKAITEAFPSWFKDKTSFETAIDHLGAFPKMERPRIIWAGLEENAEKIKDLAATVENNLCRLGFPKEREDFIPHLTIGRVKSSHNIKLLGDTLRNYTIPFDIRQTISSITFFQSTLTPQGPVYDPLQSVKLSG